MNGNEQARRQLAERYDIVLPAEAERAFATAIVVTTWNRPAPLRRMWSSLAASDLGDALVIVVDDASDDPETRRMLTLLGHRQAAVIKLRRRVRGAPCPHGGLRDGWDLACALGAATLVNLDADMIVKPHWLGAVLALHREATLARGECVVTGFNALDHRVVSAWRGAWVKRSVGGANLLIARATYEQWVRDCLNDQAWDWNVVRAARARGAPLLATRPSVCQHVGRHGLWSNWLRGMDRAPDFACDWPPWVAAQRATRLPRRVLGAIKQLFEPRPWPG